jgi:hypothetical protein
MSKMKDYILDLRQFADKELESCEPECIGCETKVGVTKCDNTMCVQCWEAETHTAEDYA